jgi:hypothetical protein
VAHASDYVHDSPSVVVGLVALFAECADGVVFYGLDHKAAGASELIPLDIHDGVFELGCDGGGGFHVWTPSGRWVYYTAPALIILFFG